LKLLAGSIAIGGISLSSPSAAGSWKHQVDQNDGNILTCSDDGKVTFYIGGRGFALHVKYPGEARDLQELATGTENKIWKRHVQRSAF